MNLFLGVYGKHSWNHWPTLRPLTQVQQEDVEEENQIFTSSSSNRSSGSSICRQLLGIKIKGGGKT